MSTSDSSGVKNWTQLKLRRTRHTGQLVDRRTIYLKLYPNRTFSPTIEENTPYEKLLSELQCDELEDFRLAAKEQAKSAVEHFKEDFIYKIRSAIKEAYQRRDELNRIISRLDFGKDKYQFVITKNKGPDGRYYKMFMDDSLSINPSQLSDSMENQMNLFTMEHDEEYGDMMNEVDQYLYSAGRCDKRGTGYCKEEYGEICGLPDVFIL